MNNFEWILLSLAVGVAGGACIVLFLRSRDKQLSDQSKTEKQQVQSEIFDAMQTAFKALSKDALSANADDFIKLAKTKLENQTVQNEQTLENKKKLIDARLKEMDNKLGQVNTLMHSIEKERAASHGSLKTQLEKTTQATNRLQDTTSQLREALANPQRRGQWGERMAEDVLRLAGFVEGINYEKQKVLASGSRPDFTFSLPGQKWVHMDVKFPLGNYMKMLDQEEGPEQETFKAQFLKDVRLRIKEVTSRDYIDPSAGTVDCVLVFIPNEQIYGFIHQHDSTLLDDAMRNKVVLCSPLTLYAILAVIRQAVDNFRLEQGAKQILDLLVDFKKQWEKYGDSMDKMGQRLNSAMEEYTHLSTTRTRQLERQIDKIDDLREVHQQHVDAIIPSAKSLTSDQPEAGIQSNP